MPRVSIQQNLINHVGFVIDGSGSMVRTVKDVIKVNDELITFLKEQSVSKDQETRVTMYVFGTNSDVVCYDVDVLRTPSIRSFYSSNFGQTALIDTIHRAITDMKQTATLYGDHAFLLYVLTDGYENASRATATTLKNDIIGLPENWTVAGLVPDRLSQRALEGYGFPLENTMMWDSLTSEGVQQAGQIIQQATTNYFEARSQGVRGTRNLFSLNTQFLQPEVITTTLTKVDPARIKQFTVAADREVIADAVRSRFGSYRQGSTYYQLTKPEEVQPQKSIIVRDKATGDLYSGASARQLLGLPNVHTRVAPAHHEKYDIFVQSTSSNRKLVGGTTAIVL